MAGRSEFEMDANNRLVLGKAGTRAAVVHGLMKAEQFAPVHEIEARADRAVSVLSDDAQLSVDEADAVVARAVSEMRASPVSFDHPKAPLVVTSKSLGTRRTITISRPQ